MKKSQIIPVKELKNHYESIEHNLEQCSKPMKSTIKKTVVSKLGFSKVTGLLLETIKNPRFDKSRVGTVNPISGCEYSETEYQTLTSWIFE